MEELAIKMDYDPAHVKNIYYRNGQGSLFTYPPTRKVLSRLLFIFLGTGIFFIATYQWAVLRWIAVIGVIALIIAAVKSAKVISNYQQWKKQIEGYLKDIGKYNSYSIRLTLAALEITMDENTFIEKWDNIRTFEINDMYIVLYKSAESTYLFPARCMRQHEFESLKDFIKNKVMAPSQS
jgi:hypothetical protein